MTDELKHMLRRTTGEAKWDGIKMRERHRFKFVAPLAMGEPTTNGRRPAMKRKRRQDFTIVELIVVVAIVAILAGLLLPALKKAKDAAKGILCLSNQKQIGYGFSSYADDYGGYFSCGDFSLCNWFSIYKGLGYVSPKVSYCPSGPAIPSSGQLWYCYGAPGFSSALFSYSTLVTKDASNNYYVNWGRINDPSKFGLGLADTVSSVGRQMYVMQVDYNAGAGTISMRHGNRANGWFVDGHAEAMDGFRVHEIAKEVTGSTWVKIVIGDRVAILAP